MYDVYVASFVVCAIDAVVRSAHVTSVNEPATLFLNQDDELVVAVRLIKRPDSVLIITHTHTHTPVSKYHTIKPRNNVNKFDEKLSRFSLKYYTFAHYSASL